MGGWGGGWLADFAHGMILSVLDMFVLKQLSAVTRVAHLGTFLTLYFVSPSKIVLKLTSLSLVFPLSPSLCCTWLCVQSSNWSPVLSPRRRRVEIIGNKIPLRFDVTQKSSSWSSWSSWPRDSNGFSAQMTSATSLISQ